MTRHKSNPDHVQPVDLIPALSGLIGKTALVTSFAMMWAAQLKIANPAFVSQNVRIEMIIGSVITLLAAFLSPQAAPSGTLAPLIVMVPVMASFGVHPLILGILSGLFGILVVRLKLFHKLITLSGPVNKASLTLTIGLSGVYLSLKNLIHYFENKQILIIILAVISVLYCYLQINRKAWLIIPAAAVISVCISTVFGITPDLSDPWTFPVFNPSYWWNGMWGIGYGFQIGTILRTAPFALFVILLWAIDTVSIQTMLEAYYKPGEPKEEIDLDRSILITASRNIVGSILGGAQTSALWRSFLIPLFTVKRPLRPAAVLLGIFGIIAGFTALPVKVLSFPPLIWTVLLFGIFLPFTLVGFRSLRDLTGSGNKAVTVLGAFLGLLFNPAITWFSSVLYERILLRFDTEYKKHQKKLP